MPVRQTRHDVLIQIVGLSYFSSLTHGRMLFNSVLNTDYPAVLCQTLLASRSELFAYGNRL